MEVFRKPLSNVFAGDRRYVIPLFQRPYVWTRELQWEPLWEDIVNCAEVELAKKPDDTLVHFLGAIVIQQCKTWGDELLTHEVIDGQQRLTTFQIFLAALRDIAQRHNVGQVSAWLEGLTRNATAIADPDVEQFKLWPTGGDIAQFRLVSSLRSIEAIEQIHPPVVRKKRLQPRPRMVEAYVYFHQAISDWLKEAGEDEVVEHLRVLRRVVDKRLQLVSIELDGHEDPQVIFETLNARGVPLLASDLLRNFIFRRAEKDAERLHELYWARFLFPDDPKVPDGARFWDVEVRQGRLFRARLDLFVQHYLAMKLGKDVAAARLFPEYKSWIENSRPFSSVESELQELVAFAERFHELLCPDPSTPLGRFAERMRVLDVSTVYPLVLALLADPKLPADDRVGIFADLESFLVRRLVCTRSTKAYNRFFLQVLRDFEAAPKHDRKCFREILSSGTGDTVDWPDDATFQSAWLTLDAYRDLKAARVEMILRAIEEAIRDQKSERITLHGTLTIEHVMPQSWQEHWPLPEDMEKEAALLERDENIHDFGNLTLLTQPLNSSVRNSGASEKLPKIAEQSSLKLNAYFQGRSIWNEGEIRDRGAKLFAVALRIWTRPSTR